MRASDGPRRGLLAATLALALAAPGVHAEEAVTLRYRPSAATLRFRLTADDSELTASDDVIITVAPEPVANTAPTVSAGADQNITLPAGADWSADDLNQMGAWLKFDLSDVIPVGAFVDPEYFVAVGWDDWGFPNVGYSNFELDCSANWTDGGSGAWKQNSGMDCSWPMLKIEVESLNEGSCD